MKSKLHLFLVTIFVCLSATAQTEKKIDNSLETKLANFKINELYRAGEYLIYDCRLKAFTCVDENSNETCKMRREDSKARKNRKLSCAPLKKFDDREKCLIENYKALEAAHFERFCFQK